jgi:hypothetical protein
VERDAASRAPIFKLIVPQPDGGSLIYQLSAPASVDLPAVVGKTAEVSGTVTVEKRARRDVHVLTIKTLKVVSDRCGGLGIPGVNIALVLPTRAPWTP